MRHFDAMDELDWRFRYPARHASTPEFDHHLRPSDAEYQITGKAVPLGVVGEGDKGTVRSALPTIALTFDDIPVHGPLPPGETRVGIIRKITASLKRAEAPAFGFLNAGFGGDDLVATAAITAWRAAALPLGSHGYSHCDLDRVGVTAFAADVARNDPPLASAAGGADWHWFRYSFLSGGKSPAMRDAARAAAQDARMRAHAIAGRDISYVLLMHGDAFDAHMLPRLPDLYRRMGFRFVTLPAAQADPFHAAANDLLLPGPTPSLAGPAALPLAGPPPGLCS